jgi:hypothetical protein
MDPMTLALIGGGLGVGKYFLDKEKEDKQRALAAETARWSPWTGMQAQMPQQADLAGPVMQGALTGAMMGQYMGGGEAAGAEAAGAAPQGPMSPQSGYSDDFMTWLNLRKGNYGG